ncbi:MAG: hypothetical protein OXD33_05535 [Rhodobacteraceae bacterium]|nr:hypothetical protein [Paracoccaceae bacterium]
MMNNIWILCISVAIVMSGLSVSAQQLPWKGSLDSLSEFTGVLNLSNEEVARRTLIVALSDPSIQLESVSLHLYAYEDACQDSFLWHKLANHYGALKFSVSVDDGTIEKKWYDELNNACDPNAPPKSVTLCHPVDLSNQECGIANDFRENLTRELVADLNKNNHFIIMTEALPYAESLAEFRGLCDLEMDYSGQTVKRSACSRKLSLR